MAVDVITETTLTIDKENKQTWRISTEHNSNLLVSDIFSLSLRADAEREANKKTTESREKALVDMEEHQKQLKQKNNQKITKKKTPEKFGVFLFPHPFSKNQPYQLHSYPFSKNQPYSFSKNQPRQPYSFLKNQLQN